MLAGVRMLSSQSPAIHTPSTFYNTNSLHYSLRVLNTRASSRMSNLFVIEDCQLTGASSLCRSWTWAA